MKSFIFLLIATVFLFSCEKSEENEQVAEKQAVNLMPTGVIKPENVKEIVGIGKIEPESEIVSLAANTGGIVEAIYKNDGDKVIQGEALLKLEDEVEQIEISQIQSQIATQKSQILLEQANNKETEARLAGKNKTIGTSKNLLKTGAETAQNLQDLETDAKVFEANLGKNKSSIEVIKSKIGELEQQLRIAQVKASKKTLKAPTNGVILDLTAKKGSALSQFADFAEFAPEGKTIVRAEIDELFADRVRIGQKVEIKLVGNQERITTGKVIVLAPYLKKKSLFSEKADDKEDRRVREIKISLDDEGKLLLNTKVECIIKL